MSAVMTKDGGTVATKKEQLECWAEHFEEILKIENPVNPLEPLLNDASSKEICI